VGIAPLFVIGTLVVLSMSFVLLYIKFIGPLNPPYMIIIYHLGMFGPKSLKQIYYNSLPFHERHNKEKQRHDYREHRDRARP